MMGLRETVEFPSRDGLLITADFYPADHPRGFMLLCHRSHSNRAEYRETAPRFAELGFSCLAMDQRSGMKIFGETNETSRRAKEAGLATGYLDARIDIEAAIDFCYERNGKRPILVVGSSYSASLGLLCSVDNPKVSAVLAFSPGEYLKGVSVQDRVRGLRKPVFVASALAEVDQVTEVVRLVGAEFVTQHVPTAAGFHGSKMLWKSVDGWEGCWAGVKAFLVRVHAE